jgi:hypothetical protein
MGIFPRCVNGMIRAASDVSSFFQDRELDYVLLPIKIKMKRGLPRIASSSFELAETKEGDVIEVSRWVSEVLVDMGFAEVQGEPFEVEVFKALSRERIQGPLQLSTLKSEFYLKMRRHLSELKMKSERNGTARADFEKFSVSTYDLLTLRLSKLLYLASSSSTHQDLLDKITPEERLLFEEAHRMVVSWRKAVLEGVS